MPDPGQALVGDQGLLHHCPPGGTPYYTVTVTPDTQTDAFRLGDATAVLTVHINRFNGYSAAVNVQFGNALFGWSPSSTIVASGGTLKVMQPYMSPVYPGGDTFSQTKPGGNEVLGLDTVPDEFTLTFTGPRTGWVGASLDPGYQDRSRLYSGSVQSNIFSVSTSEPYFWLEFVPKDTGGSWHMPSVAWAFPGVAYDPNWADTYYGALTVGDTYVIVNPGSSDFTLVGAPDSNPGTVFTATGSGTSLNDGTDGRAVPNFGSDGQGDGGNNTYFGLTCLVHRVNGHSAPITLSIPPFDGTFDGNTIVYIAGVPLQQSDLSGGYSLVVTDNDGVEILINSDSAADWPLGSSWSTNPGLCITGTDTSGQGAVTSNYLIVTQP